MSLLFNTLSRFVIAFLPRSKRLLISWLQSPSTVILEPKKIKSVTASMSYPSICHEVMGQDAMIFIFWILTFKPAFSLSSFTLIKRLFSSYSLSAIRVVSSAYLWLLTVLLTVLIPACTSSGLALHISHLAWQRRLRICLQCRRPELDPRVRTIPWRRAWQPTPVFWPGESHGQRNLVGYSSQGCRESNMTEVTACTHAAYKLNKQGDNILAWHTSFPILSQSVVPCKVLPVASWLVYRFLRRQVKCSGIPVSLRIFHCVLWPT